MIIGKATPVPSVIDVHGLRCFFTSYQPSLSLIFFVYTTTLVLILLRLKHEMSATVHYPTRFSDALVDHCKSGHVPPEVFCDVAKQVPTLPRYVRMHPSVVSSFQAAKSDVSHLVAEMIEWLSRELDVPSTAIHYVEWSLSYWCFAVPRSTSLSDKAAYKRGDIVPMDVASVAAVMALSPCEGDVVLDVCCAPAMKLCTIADRVGQSGLVVGVDLSTDRLFTARSLVARHGASSTTGSSSVLFSGDGCTFDMKKGLETFDPLSERVKVKSNGLTANEERRLGKKRSRKGSSVGTPGTETCSPVYAPLTARETLKQRCASLPLFDRVLVDAECTHDGSIAHLDLGEAGTAGHAGISNTHRTLHINVSNDNTDNPVKSVPDLQLQLLLNGYAQLKNGGTLVYATCSFSFLQNEKVLVRFLQTEHGTSHPEVIPAFASCSGEGQHHLVSLQSRLNACHDHYSIVSNGLREMGRTDLLEDMKKGLLGSRFYPCVFQTSFQYIVKIRKVPVE
ncbi:hypothetical protein AGDE_09745 [Angomonas deanei]|nr:hypothetical protein AGDE_09745 [Angomonas deanei]|eukprot:EPY29865.1 hypothetical protein AGDE_09745 [Angomonas deanei]